MNTQDRGQSGSNIGKRRGSLCNREWIRLTSHPHHSVVFPLGALHQIGYVADAIPVDDCGTLSFSVPSQLLSRPVPSGSIPVTKDRCPPAEWPVKTTRSVSMLYCFAFLTAQRRAQRQSSTAAGASETSAMRYSTLMTFQPISRYGRKRCVAPVRSPKIHPPP